MFLQRKEAFWQNRSLWTTEPMLHLIPHWNHAGREGELIDVWAYTNCDEAELFVNGESLGRVTVEPHGHAEWKAEYRPGKIEAVGYIGGVEVCRDGHETTGSPATLRLIPENAGDVSANGEDIAVFTCVALDDMGREVPDAAVTVRFAVNSLGTIVGTGSDVCDHTPVAAPIRKMRAGRISVAVRTKKASGKLTLYATCDTLPTARCEVSVAPMRL